MEANKNIDRLFQEKFKDFEATPNPDVWDRINQSLQQKKKKRRVLPIWFKLGGVAAGIALLLTIGYAVFNDNTNNNTNSPVVNTDTKENTSEENTPKKESEAPLNINLNTTKANAVTEVNSAENNLEKATQEQLVNTTKNQNSKSQNASTYTNYTQNKAANNTLKSNKKAVNTNLETNTTLVNQSTTNANKNKVTPQIEINSDLLNNELQNNTLITENQHKSNDKNEALNTDINKQNIEDAIAENNKTEENLEDKLNNEEAEQPIKRWSITPNVAPVYFGSLSEGSSLAMQFADNPKQGNINMSYGLNGAYNVTKRLKVKTGVNKVNLSQTTTNVLAFTTASTLLSSIDEQPNHISFNANVQSVSLMSTNAMNRASVPEVFNTKIAGNLEQRLGFIEVPLELEYRLIDQRLGLNVIGGFSTLFLNNNQVYADVDGTTTLIGEADNINDASFSANFGLGIDYGLSKKINLNLQPTFKYQLNTFNNTSGNFRPYFFGVYTGLSFKF